MMESGPEALKEILARLFAAKGWGRRQARLHLEKAWESAVGARFIRETRVLALRRGILEIEVNNGVLLQELAAFHKRGLLDRLRGALPGEKINDLKFRAGTF